MRRCVLLALPLSLLAISAAFADVPLPKDLKYVDPRVRFEGVDKHADHVFYLRFLSFTGSPANIPYTLIEVKDTKPFNLNAQRRLSDSSLLAIERKDFDQRKKDDPSLKWLTDKTPGVLRAALANPSTTISVKLKEVPVTTYRVNLKDGKLTAEMVKNEPRTEATPEGVLPLWTFALAFSLSLAGFGLWFARWRSAR